MSACHETHSVLIRQGASHALLRSRLDTESYAVDQSCPGENCRQADHHAIGDVRPPEDAHCTSASNCLRESLANLMPRDTLPHALLLTLSLAALLLACCTSEACMSGAAMGTLSRIRLAEALVGSKL